MASLMKGNQWHERCDAKKRNGDPVVTYPVYVEDKHDEIRCHVIVDYNDPHGPRVTFLSYSGKPLANMLRFHGLFITLAWGTGHYEFDMGFECNGNFNDSYRWVRSTNGVPADLMGATFKFFIFGLPSAEGTILQQHHYRVEVAQYAEDWCSIPVLVPHFIQCADSEQVDAAFSYARHRGLEGVMVKQPDALYERKRTDGWLKMKNSDTYDGKIVGLLEAHASRDFGDGVKKGDPLGRTGSVQLVLEDGSFASPHGIPHELGRDMHTNPDKYIGCWVEFDAMEIDRQGGYRHPVFRRLRDAKD